MKFFVPLALLVAAVSAQDPNDCDAANIVEACLQSERAKMTDCGTADYDCQCAAAEAIATCYNNCPNDTRKPGAEGDIQIYCGQASVFGSRATARASASSQTAGSSEATSTTGSESSSTGSAGPEETGSSGAAAKAGSMLLAAAGMMAVVV